MGFTVEHHALTDHLNNRPGVHSQADDTDTDVINGLLHNYISTDTIV